MCYTLNKLMTKTLGEKLKGYREEKFKNMGLRKAAEEIGIDFTHLNRIERGLRPSAETLKKFSQKYGLSQDEEAELFASAKIIHPDVSDYLKQNPKEAMAFFRKTKK